MAGAILAFVALETGARPLGWVLVTAIFVTVAVAGLLAKLLRRSATQLTAFTFAAVMLSWPVLITALALVINGPGD